MTVVKMPQSMHAPAYRRIEAIIKAAADLGMRGFALAKLRTVATEQIEPLTIALEPFAAFGEKAEQFIEARAADGGSGITPIEDFRLSDFRRAREVLTPSMAVKSSR